jgi:hypothetical protein
VGIVAVLNRCGRARLKLSGTAGNLHGLINRADPFLINLPQISATFRVENFKNSGPTLVVETFIG